MFISSLKPFSLVLRRYNFVPLIAMNFSRSGFPCNWIYDTDSWLRSNVWILRFLVRARYDGMRQRRHRGQ
jgi:hypothetical protein